MLGGAWLEWYVWCGGVVVQREKQTKRANKRAKAGGSDSGIAKAFSKGGGNSGGGGEAMLVDAGPKKPSEHVRHGRGELGLPICIIPFRLVSDRALFVS
jgi:hypothetical protein